MKYVEDWKREEIEYGKKMIEESKQKRKELDKILKEKYNGSQIKTIIGYDGRSYRVLVDEVVEYMEKYKYYKGLSEEKLIKDIEKHFESLQQKVEKKIGKIIEIEHLGGHDYSFIGENDSCNVEVILAGGYNVQRKHTRYIISKYYKRCK